MTDMLELLRAALRGRGFEPHPFQERTWRAFENGRSGLVHVPTGAGKTFAAAFGPLAELEARRRANESKRTKPRTGLLWITPLRATARDTERALQSICSEAGFGLRIETRSGDTEATVRARQSRRPPEVLITTPESMSLMLTRKDAAERLAGLVGVVLDEWHELLSTKRGSLTELALARLRRFAPNLRTWALSATLQNLDEAAATAVGDEVEALLVRGSMKRPIEIETLLPDDLDAFPWAGHLGTRMVEPLIERLDPERSTLIFTNTRAQAELWHDALRRARPEWFDRLGLHHGSIDRAERTVVEEGLKRGRITIVVATSSLDLGVDFGPVERVVQIGSIRSIARLLQRAGRSAHRPNAPCNLLFVPTHGLELVEAVAMRHALRDGEIEPRRPLQKPLDVLAQHLVTCAVGGGFLPDELFDEVRRARSFRQLQRDEFDWTLDLLRAGSGPLEAYPEYRRLQTDPGSGLEVLQDRRKVTWHRMNVGTITGHGSVELKFMNGRSLGTCEETFISRLRPGETFLFGGRLLEVVTQDGLTIRVRSSTRPTRHTPRWAGGKLPISDCLGRAMRNAFERIQEGRTRAPELRTIRPLLRAQSRLSRLPSADAVLSEHCTTRDGAHLFLFPFEGRLVHEGLAALLALRLSRLRKATFALAVNDYGLEILCSERGYPFGELVDLELFSADRLNQDQEEAIDTGSMARYQFRDVARVAGLVHQNLPRQRRSMRALQTSAGLVYDVFARHNPDNLLLGQARREVLEGQFERDRLVRLLDRVRQHGLEWSHPDRPTPLGFPLVIERVRARLSNESLEDRIERMRRDWEQAAKEPMK